MLSLSEKELKDDLKMKMGDRKKLLNYISFLVEEVRNEEKESTLKNKSYKKNK